MEIAEARNLAIRRLSIREYSSRELESYLRRKGAAEADAAEVVRVLREEGLVDDLRYARVLVRHHSHRDKGPMHILATLRAKGVTLELRDVRRLLDEVSDRSEDAAARAVIERRYPGALEGDPDQKRKAFQALLRRGFSADAIRRALSVTS